MDIQVISVTEFVNILNETLNFAYPAVTIEGEVGSFKVNQGKWVFFDVKDDESTLGCFMPVYQLKVALEDGMKVRITGTPKLTKWGKFSLTVRTVELAGEGELRRAFELLKQRLGSEGIFDDERKRRLPQYPEVIGLITSGQSAAYSDFIKILSQRWGGLKLILADVQVQGTPAPDQIVRALEHFNQLSPAADVVVLIRGGGSLEDLQAFNTESVARAVAASRSPIIVGVGHEVDESLADYAADVRAATPTDAARLVVPDRQEVGRRVEGAMRNIEGSFFRRLNRLAQELERQRALVYRMINMPRTHLMRMESELWRKLELLRQSASRKHDIVRKSCERLMIAQSGAWRRQQLSLESLVRVLKSFDPAATLLRGYAIVRHENVIIRSPKQVSNGDRLMLQLRDGVIRSKVED